MRGHEALIAMRLKRRVPALVWISTDPDRLKAWRDWQHVSPHRAEVQIDEADPLNRLDLRFVIGLTVQVQGQRRERVEALRRACIEFGAQRVITSLSEQVGERLVRLELIEITDTEGQLTWQQ